VVEGAMSECDVIISSGGVSMGELLIACLNFN